ALVLDDGLLAEAVALSAHNIDLSDGDMRRSAHRTLYLASSLPNNQVMSLAVLAMPPDRVRAVQESTPFFRVAWAFHVWQPDIIRNSSLGQLLLGLDEDLQALPVERRPEAMDDVSHSIELYIKLAAGHRGSGFDRESVYDDIESLRLWVHGELPRSLRG